MAKKYQKDASKEDISKVTKDVALDAIRSNAPPEQVCNSLKVVLQEKYIKRIQRTNLRSTERSIKQKFFDFMNGTKRYNRGMTEQALGAIYRFLKLNSSLSPIKKLEYIKLYLSRLLRSYHVTGFLYDLHDAIDIYLNPRRKNPWTKIFGKSKIKGDNKRKVYNIGRTSDQDDYDDNEYDSTDYDSGHDQDDDYDKSPSDTDGKDISRIRTKPKQIRPLRKLKSNNNIKRNNRNELYEENLGADDDIMDTDVKNGMNLDDGNKTEKSLNEVRHTRKRQENDSYAEVDDVENNHDEMIDDTMENDIRSDETDIKEASYEDSHLASQEEKEYDRDNEDNDNEDDGDDND